MWVVKLVVFESRELAIGWLWGGGCSALDAGPAGDQVIIGASILGLAETLAESVEAVSKLANGLGFAAHDR